jgi:hypothetical protein
MSLLADTNFKPEQLRAMQGRKKESISDPLANALVAKLTCSNLLDGEDTPSGNFR